MTRPGRVVQAVAGGAVSLVFLWVALRQVTVDDVARHLGQTRYDLLALAMIAGVAMTWARGVRWRYFFHPDMPPAGTLTSATIVGYMANNVLPMRAGDVVRVYIVGQRTRVPVLTIMTTLIIERAFDIVVTLGMLLGVVALVPLPAVIRHGALVLCGLTIAVMSVLTALAMSSRGAHAEGWLRQVRDGARCLRPSSHLVPLLGWTGAAWAINIVALWLALAAAGLRVPFGAALAVLAFTGLALAVPSGPGHVGTQELCIVLALGLFGVSASHALGFAVLLRLANVVPMTVAGLVALNLGPISWGQVTRAARAVPTA
jgi:uncharacterized membrane protein YbhN (UPF0104 family)